jgi:phosphatidylserine/phosphatidylglycerophosphate/cardiolipin synthase-like enzyme
MRWIKFKTHELIFNHDFAKALWGEHTDTLTVQNNSLNVKQVIDMNGWRYHLQQMVIADDPIKYLGKNLGSE